MTPTFIMAVPWEQERVKRVRDLKAATGATVIWDQQHDAMDTWRRTLEALGDEAGIILEDDVQLAENWRNRIEEVIKDHRADVIQFFSMRSADLTVGSRYEPGRTFMMNQCYYLPAGAAPDLLENTRNWEAENPKDANGYDMAMARWMQDTKRRYWLQVPSLVQHERWRSQINPKRSSARQSLTFEQPVPSAPLPLFVHVMTASGFDERRDEQVQWWKRTYPTQVDVHDDKERAGILTNFLEIVRCMAARAADHGDEWQLVVSDDVKPIEGWENALEQVMRTCPTDVVSPTHFAGHGVKVAKRGAPYGVGINTTWGPAMMYRKSILPEFLRLVEDVYAMNPTKYRKWDDGFPAVYNLLYGTQTSFTSRAIFEHQDWESTLGHVPGKWRHAESTIRDEGPAWGAEPRTASSGISPEPSQKALAAELTNYRKAMGLPR